MHMDIRKHAFDGPDRAYSIYTDHGLTMNETETMSGSLTVGSETMSTPLEIPAFVEAVTNHQSLVFSIAYHMLHNPSLAEEVAQDVFFRLYRDYHRIQSASHLIHWLRRTTTHRCLDALRRSENRRLIPLDGMENVLPAASEEPDPILERTLRRLVAGLPLKSRAIVVLRYQEDLEPREIARILGLPVNTVKSRLQRALTALRTALRHREGSMQQRITRTTGTASTVCFLTPSRVVITVPGKPMYTGWRR